ncbi:transcription factor subunit (nucleomorph) [Cryptomonas paramecium]|uniref:Transcription factor subunit n=1 Tax=Cryptomonas paramaecium TaxID=2898 RepID=F2HHN8_9CRYP|nr:transcription factor subunit [Cryptomonas paramecium]AEA38834.1 transcription factor subunit [Cryptomonas paramecium]|mmetsp:Transcript_58661/g.155133  ORF Transcript_58661/g.155133 Transcript_58661/m.155133 type:complete len:372 (-) Transcript_58661:5509-6624(-)
MLKIQVPFELKILQRRFLWNLKYKILSFYNYSYYENIYLKCNLNKSCKNLHFFGNKFNWSLNIIFTIFLWENTNLINNFCFFNAVNSKVEFRKFIEFDYLCNENLFFLKKQILNQRKIQTLIRPLNFEKNYRIIPIDIIFFFTKRLFRKIEFEHMILDFKFFYFFLFKKKFEKKNVPLFCLDFRSIIDSKYQFFSSVDFLNDGVALFPEHNSKFKLFTMPFFILGYISFFLKKRPIWTKKNLESHVPFFLKKYLKKILPLYCFKFVHFNPFRRTWIRLGYDPRIHVRSFIYQTFHIKKSCDSSIKSYGKKFTTKILYKQLCDIRLNFIKTFLRKFFFPTYSFIDPFCGWLKILCFVIIKKKIKRNFSSLYS